MRNTDRVFGAKPPSSFVRISVFKMEGGRPVKTTSFSIYGVKYDKVAENVGTVLANDYGDADDDADEGESAPVAPPVPLKKVAVKKRK